MLLLFAATAVFCLQQQLLLSALVLLALLVQVLRLLRVLVVLLLVHAQVVAVAAVPPAPGVASLVPSKHDFALVARN
jgi:hypothetical protein